MGFGMGAEFDLVFARVLSEAVDVVADDWAFDEEEGRGDVRERIRVCG